MNYKKINILTIISTLAILLLPGVLLAAEVAGQGGYELLAPLPEFDKVYTPGNLGEFVQKAIYLAIIIAAVLATIKIVIGGFKYMTSESMNLKEEGKGDIQHALLGLAILIASFLILNTINPQLLNFRLDIAQVGVQQSQTTQGRPAPQTGFQKEAAEAGFNISTVPSEKMSPQEWGGQRGEAFRTRCREAAAALGNSQSANPGYLYGEADCLLNTKVDVSSSAPYSASDLQSYGSTIQSSLNTSGVATIPIRTGSADELQNVRSYCPSSFNGKSTIFYKESGNYICKVQ